MRRTGLVALGLLVALVMMPTRLMSQSLDELTQQAITAQDSGKSQEAENIWRKILQNDPNNAYAHYKLCDVLDDQNKITEAESACRSSVQINPNDAKYQFLLGDVLSTQGKKEEAIAAYSKAIELQPDADTYNNLGNALDDFGKKEEAIAAYCEAIELDPKYAKAYYNMGYVLDSLGKLEEAITAYRKAIELDPNNTQAYNNLGIALERQGKLEEAINAYQKAIQLDPNRAFPYRGLGDALRKQGQLEEAINAYRKAIQLDPKFPQAYYGLSMAMSALGKKEEASAAYRKAAHNALGWVYQQQGELKEAIQEYEAALKIDLKFEFAQTNLKEAQRLLALQQKPAQLIALNEIKYLPNDPLTPIKRSIIKIKIDFPGNAKGASYGTGYVIKRQGNKVWIITNRHVVQDQDTTQLGTNLEIEPYYGEKLPNIPRDRSTAKILKVSEGEKLDLALLETTGLPDDIQPLTIRPNQCDPGTSVTIIGHPNNRNWSEYKTIFMNIQPSTGYLLIDVTLGAGASGSPILDSNLEVIGIMARTVNASNKNSEAIGIGHPINLVIQQISQWGIKIP